MQEVRRRRVTIVGLRARLPLVARILALCVLVGGIIVVSVSYYRHRNYKPFVMIPQSPELSKQVKAIVEGYEMRTTDGGRLHIWLKAARDVTYTDEHHELEDVELKVYPATGDKPDAISAQRAIYDEKKGLASFKGNVDIATRNDLTVKTDIVVYNQKTEVAETSAPITFVRENVSGHATGALLDAKNKQLELRSNVEITVAPNNQANASAKPNARSSPVTIRAAHAHFDQNSLRLNFTGNVTAEQERDLMSGDTLTATLNEQKRLQKIEARGNSYLRSMTEGRAAEVHSADMDFFLDADQKLQRANAMRDVHAKSLDADSEMQLNGANNLEVNFQAQGNASLLKEMRTTGGRSVLTLAAPKSHANDPRAANKRLTADTVHLYWRATGKDLERAEAVGNAEISRAVSQERAARRLRLIQCNRRRRAPCVPLLHKRSQRFLRARHRTLSAWMLSAMRPLTKRIATGARRTLRTRRRTAWCVCVVANPSCGIRARVSRPQKLIRIQSIKSLTAEAAPTRRITVRNKQTARRLLRKQKALSSLSQTAQSFSTRRASPSTQATRAHGRTITLCAANA